MATGLLCNASQTHSAAVIVSCRVMQCHASRSSSSCCALPPRCLCLMPSHISQLPLVVSGNKSGVRTEDRKDSCRPCTGCAGSVPSVSLHPSTPVIRATRRSMVAESGGGAHHGGDRLALDGAGGLVDVHRCGCGVRCGDDTRSLCEKLRSWVGNCQDGGGGPIRGEGILRDGQRGLPRIAGA